MMENFRYLGASVSQEFEMKVISLLITRTNRGDFVDKLRGVFGKKGFSVGESLVPVFCTKLLVYINSSLSLSSLENITRNCRWKD